MAIGFITNLGDDTNQTEALKKCYSDADDKRKELIEYTQVESKVFVLKKFKDTKSATYNTVGNDQIVLRYADVLLMYAEALNEIEYSNSQTSDAMNALNSVHMRSCSSSIQIADLPDKTVSERPLCWNASVNSPMKDTGGSTLYEWVEPKMP